MGGVPIGGRITDVIASPTASAALPVVPLPYAVGDARPAGAITRYLLSPVGWPTLAVTGLAAASSLVAATAKPSLIAIAAIAGFAWLTVGVILVARAFFRVAVAAAEDRWSAIRHGWFRW